MSLRHSLVAALVAAAVAAPVTAHGQSTSLGIAAGASIPTGDLGQFAQVGYNATATLNVSAPLIPVGFRIDGMFNEMSWKDNNNILGGGNPKSRVWAINGNVLLNMGTGLVASPYLIGGAGWYRYTETNTGFDGSDNNLGFNIGAGLRIPLTGFSTFAEVRYHRTTGSNPLSFVPITFGILF